MNRYDAREHAFSVIFSFGFDALPETTEEIISLYEQAQEVEGDAFFYELIDRTRKNLDAIDALIESNLKNWSLKRLSKVSLAALRLGICEIRFFEDTPNPVAINEAVELAKRFEGKECGQFVNGVLSAVSGEK